MSTCCAATRSDADCHRRVHLLLADQDRQPGVLRDLGHPGDLPSLRRRQRPAPAAPEAAVRAYCDVRSVVKALAKLALVDWASTVTPVTSASPIISADAVAALRRGLRIALSRASRPTVPQIRAMGQPITRSTDGAMIGASTVTPMTVSPAPSAGQGAGAAGGAAEAQDQHRDADDGHQTGR